MVHAKAAVRAGLVSGALLTGIIGLGPAAHADDLDIDPVVAAPGQSVTVAGGCKTSDRYVSISGAARGKGAVNDGWFSVSARIAKTKPGRYRIEAKCITSNYSQQGTVRVQAKRKDHDRQPHGWAMTGGGGTQGPDLPWAPMGLAMVAGAAGIGGVALMRARARGRA